MHLVWVIVWASLGLFLGILLCMEIGLRVGRYHAARIPNPSESGTGVVDAAVFTLLGLLIGFTFSGAAERLNSRRDLIVREANAIGTAYLRLDLLPDGSQEDLRRMFRDYVDFRLRMHDNLADPVAREQYRVELNRMQGDIWSRAKAACAQQDARPTAALLLLPALNEMIDVTAARSMAITTHIPMVIVGALFAVSLMAAVLVGYGMAGKKARSILHMVLFAIIVSMSIYVILDLEYPRLGFIRLDAADDLLRHLRDTIR
jgi:hypothetical protein